MQRSNPTGILAWFASNPVAANLLMIVVFLAGTFSLLEMDRQAYPRFTSPWITLTTLYPGAGPSEVEEGVCIPIEEVIHDLRGIKQIETIALDEKCEIYVRVQQSYPIQTLVNDIRARAQSLRNLPKAVEKIDIDDDSWEIAAITVIVRGQTDKLTLRRLAEQIRDELNDLEGVRRAILWSKIAYEIAVEVSITRLQQYQLTVSDVAEAIRRESLDLPGGELKAASGGLQLRSKYTAYDRARLFDLILRTHPDGSIVRLGDIATITDGFADQRFDNTSDGIPSESIRVLPQHDLVKVAKNVRDYVEMLALQLPEGTEVITRRDNARSFNELLDRLVTVGISGFFLVTLILMLFLQARVAFWTAAGVTFSFFGAFWLLPVADVNLNMLSLFGFVLAVGVLVDDAIIVSERIHHVQNSSLYGLQGAIQGVRDVAIPVALGVTIALIAFLPGYFVTPSWATQFMKPVATVMILTLAFSLLESLFILPAHLSGGNARSNLSSQRLLAQIQAKLTEKLATFISGVYRPLLERTIRWRYTAMACFLAALIIGLAIVEGGHVGVKLQEDINYSEFHVHLNPPLGTPYSEIQERVQQFLDALDKVEHALNPHPMTDMSALIEGIEVVLDEIDPAIYVEFTSEARKRFHIREIIKRWYQYIGDVGDFQPNFHTPTEQSLTDMKIELRAQDPAILNGAADATKAYMSQYPVVANLTDSRKPGKPELRFRLKPEGERLGMSLKDLAEQVRHAYHGEEAQRFMRGRSEVKIQVRHPRDERESIDHLLTIPIRLPNGKHAPLGTLAEIDFVPGFGALKRTNRMGVISLQIQLSDASSHRIETIHQDLATHLFPMLKQQYPGIAFTRGDEAEEADEIMENLKRNTLIALMAIYILLAIAFKSYAQPLLFLLAVPFAWLGAVLAHLAADLNFSFQSLIGMVAASGVVINDSVVLLHFIQRNRAEGIHLTHLIVNACVARFRPILLVALTSIAGFAPMLFETSEQAKFLVPVTLSLAAGLSFGMIATLVLVPTCYAVLADFRDFFSKRS